MYYKDTEVARNCNVFNDHQALSRIIDARRGTGRLHQFLELGLTLGAITLFRVQGVCYFLDFLDLFSEHLLLRFHGVQAPVDAAGQAVELLLWEPPFFSSKFRWIESRTSPKASAIRKPGG